MLSSGAAFLLSLCSSPLKPALLSVCLHPSSLVTLEPFSSSYLANYSSLELSSNSCVCQAAAAVRPKMGLGIWCWVTRVVEWFSGAGELICFYYPSPFPPPPTSPLHTCTHFYCTRGKQKTMICLEMWLSLDTKPAICEGPYCIISQQNRAEPCVLELVQQSSISIERAPQGNLFPSLRN